MESLMDTLVDRRTNNNAGRFPILAPTYAQARCFFGGLVRAMYRLEVVGANRLPVTGPIVIAPNHDSVLDGIVLGAAISRELRFLAKAELRQSRLLGWVLDGLGAIGMKRGHGTGPLARQNRPPAVADHHRNADRSLARSGRTGRGDEAD